MVPAEEGQPVAAVAVEVAAASRSAVRGDVRA
jgi:hypothetical protein